MPLSRSAIPSSAPSSPYDSPTAYEPDPAGSISAASAGGEGEAERDAASPAAEEEEEREDHDAAVSEPDSEADSLRAREDAEAAEWLGTPTKKEELWAAEKKEREARSILHWSPYDRVGVVNAVP